MATRPKREATKKRYILAEDSESEENDFPEFIPVPKRVKKESIQVKKEKEPNVLVPAKTTVEENEESGSDSDHDFDSDGSSFTGENSSGKAVAAPRQKGRKTVNVPDVIPMSERVSVARLQTLLPVDNEKVSNDGHDWWWVFDQDPEGSKTKSTFDAIKPIPEMMKSKVSSVHDYAASQQKRLVWIEGFERESQGSFEEPFQTTPLPNSLMSLSQYAKELGLVEDSVQDETKRYIALTQTHPIDILVDFGTKIPEGNVMRARKALVCEITRPRIAQNKFIERHHYGNKIYPESERIELYMLHEYENSDAPLLPTEFESMHKEMPYYKEYEAIRQSFSGDCKIEYKVRRGTVFEVQVPSGKTEQFVCADYLSGTRYCYGETINGSIWLEFMRQKDSLFRLRYWSKDSERRVEHTAVPGKHWMSCIFDVYVDRQELARRLQQPQGVSRSLINWLVTQVQKSIKTASLSCDAQKLVIRDSSGDAMSIKVQQEGSKQEVTLTGAEFHLQLREYQSATLQWMLQLERRVSARENLTFVAEDISAYNAHLVRMTSRVPAPYLSADGHYARPHDAFVPLHLQMKRSFRGGMLCDAVGTGKTITMLALIHAHPRTSLQEVIYSQSVDRELTVPSRASLVVCPSNLIVQWRQEAIRCYGKQAHVITIATMIDHKKVSWDQILEADLVLVSTAFLKNVNYHKFLQSLGAKKPTVVQRGSSNSNIEEMDPIYAAQFLRRTRSVYGPERGTVALHMIHWWRVIFDEFHETESLSSRADQLARRLQGTYYWGITGSPKLATANDVFDTTPFLHMAPVTEEYLQFGNAQLYLDTVARRNKPDLALPLLKEERIWVKLSAIEKALYSTLATDNGRSTDMEMLMLCNHHQVSDAMNDLSSGELMSVDQVAQLVQTSREAQIKQAERTVDSFIKRIKEIQEKSTENLTPEQLNNRRKEIQRLRQEQSTKQTEVDRLVSQYRFFSSVLQTIESVGAGEEPLPTCIICLEQVQDEDAVITRCGHVFCAPCLEVMQQKFGARSLCPTCRASIGPSDVMKLALKEKEVAAKEPEKDEDALNLDMFGSKIGSVTRFLKNKMRDEPDSKFILFIQFRRLATLVEKALAQLGIDLVRVQSNFMQRQRAIETFKDPNLNVRVMMLSSEDSVSGLHLVEANYVLLMHPFMYNDGRDPAAAEYQGIARAYRSGQTRPVTVVRFACEDTIEKNLIEKRKAYSA